MRSMQMVSEPILDGSIEETADNEERLEAEDEPANEENSIAGTNAQNTTEPQQITKRPQHMHNKPATNNQAYQLLTKAADQQT